MWYTPHQIDRTNEGHLDMLLDIIIFWIDRLTKLRFDDAQTRSQWAPHTGLKVPMSPQPLHWLQGAYGVSVTKFVVGAIALVGWSFRNLIRRLLMVLVFPQVGG